MRITGGTVARPAPEMKLIAPRGSAFAHTSIVSTCASPPTVGIFISTTLPISSAGMSAAYVSLKG